MSTRYNLRDAPNKPKKRPRNSSPVDDGEDGEIGEMSKVRGYLKVMIDQIIENEMDEQIDGVLEIVDDHLDEAFNSKLKETSKKFAKMTMPYIKSSIMSACHDMIHEHLDKFDLSLSTDKFKTLIAEVIKKDFGGTLNGRPVKKPKSGGTKIKIVKIARPTTVLGEQGVAPNGTHPPSTEKYPKKYDEATLKDHSDKIVQQIVNLETTVENKSVIYKEYVSKRGKRDAKQQDWLDSALAMPYSHKIDYPISSADPNSRINTFLLKMQQKLDETVHGMKEAKEEILLEVMKRITSSESNGKILVLEGPPGIGKTYLSRSVGECMGIPFESLSLGGCRDASILNGMDYCYVGSHMGAVARALKGLKCCNGLFYLDEIDKIGQTERSREVSASFLSILDESQNSEFVDNYLFDLKLDLSKLFVIGSCNDSQLIDPILRNRMKIIKLPVPTQEDKIAIVKQHFIPMYLKQYEVPASEIVFTDDVIKYIMKKTKEEPGVRELKRGVEHIISRFNLLRKTHVKTRKSRKTTTSKKPAKKTLEFSFSIPNFETPLQLTSSIIDKFMTTINTKEEESESAKRMYL